MPLYTEIDHVDTGGGRIASVLPGSLAHSIGLKVGDVLMSINDEVVQDVIDVQYYAAEEELELLLRRDSTTWRINAERNYEQQLGIIFEHPTFDIDIRRCNNLCEFCFVLQMAPRFRRSLYIKDDDYRYSFLFGHFVTLTNLDQHDWDRIEEMRLSPLYISVHVTDPEMRRRFLRNEKAPDIMEQLRWLGERGIEMHTQLVIVPQFNDGIWLKNSLADLAQLWPSIQSVSIVPVGITKHNKYGMRPHTAIESTEMLDYLKVKQDDFLNSIGTRFAYPTDEWFIVSDRDIPEADYYDGVDLFENGLGVVRRFLDEWSRVKTEIAAWNAFHSDSVSSAEVQQLLLITGSLFEPILIDCMAEFQALSNVSAQVKGIVNGVLGETITVAGLLMAKDVIDAVKDNQTVDVIVLPRIMFDHPDSISLDNLSPQDVSNQTGTPVALADTMGDVWDIVTGNSATVVQPTHT